MAEMGLTINALPHTFVLSDKLLATTKICSLRVYYKVEESNPQTDIIQGEPCFASAKIDRRARICRGVKA